MKWANLFLLGAVICAFIFVVVPGILFLLDLLLRKPLGQRIFVVQWNKIGIILGLVFGLIYWLLR
jgi:hypothetical protein